MLEQENQSAMLTQITEIITFLCQSCVSNEQIKQEGVSKQWCIKK